MIGMIEVGFSDELWIYSLFLILLFVFVVHLDGLQHDFGNGDKTVLRF